MYRRLRSLRARLALAAAGAILVAVAGFGGAGLVLLRLELRRSLDGALRARATEVDQLAATAPALLKAPGALESVVSGRQIAVEVLDAHGRLLVRSLALGARLLPLDRLARRALEAGRSGFEDTTSGGRPYRLFAAPVPQASGDFAAGGAVLVASDTSDTSETLRRLTALLAASAVIASLLAFGIALVLTRRGLRPLRTLAAGAAEIERTADSDRRLPAPRAPDEIGELTGVLNRMLSSLSAARENERRFLADASHELRTPVTSLRGNVEYAVRHGASAEVLAELEADAERLARLVDDLLALERAGGGHLDEASPAKPVDAIVDLVALASEVALAAEPPDGREVRLAGHDAPVVVRGDREALTRAVRNLVENAIVHGRGAVTLTAAPGPVGTETVTLTVADEGTGPDLAEADALFERFRRGADAAGRPGSGLGLSIVRAVARRHGGEARVEGSAFTVELPRAR